MLHSLVHIEGVAVDLAWDAIARYGACMPREFSDDFVTVAEDEARHFVLLEAGPTPNPPFHIEELQWVAGIVYGLILLMSTESACSWWHELV